MEDKDLGELARRCHENAVKHGFWKDNPSYAHCMMLVITEITELVEADRKGKYTRKEDMMKDGFDRDIFEKYYKNTVEDEMADIAIRLLDLAGKYRYTFPDLGFHIEMIKSRFVLRTLPENAFELCKRLFNLSPPLSFKANLSYLSVWAESLGIDLERHVMMKMEYNESRPALHGKKY